MNGADGIADIEQRRRALDPSTSFIVQAPAGSGKTELLIQRYLMLLACVERPEEITSITFTRKSAAEMRRRVLEALADARQGPPPAELHRALTWKHARSALEHDRRRGWRLEDNPARLRIQTIDALCASLTRHMPVMSAFGAQPESMDDALPLYREAARATLALIEDEGAAGELVARLLAHLDNNLAVAEGLIADMLARRDHWLRTLSAGRDREALEGALREERQAHVARVMALWPADSALRPSAEATVEDCRHLAETLLTRAGTWRKRRPEAQALDGNEPLRTALHALRRLPPGAYSAQQWDALEAILRLLPVALAELKLAFGAHGRADFVEIAQGALAALGESDAPTDLMLSLDYRIRHILVDEFQDTSFTQYRLLQKLTEGWEAGDGRTLFLVGDPMQSIYRFREAEVGLFLKARSEGIGCVRLEALRLSANFRSQANIVEWVNGAFSRVMPAQEQVASGAVPYSPSQAVHRALDGGVSVHAFFNGDSAAEAARVAALVQKAQQVAGGTVAVLVRNRSHLEDIVPALKRVGLRFRAIEIEPLGHRQAVQDLLALTRALAHPADRLAWLAVLRAPWCGLTLADLHALAGEGRATPAAVSAEALTRSSAINDLFPETLAGAPARVARHAQTDPRTVWELLNDEARLARVSADGGARAVRVREVLRRALAQRLRGSLRDRVENVWLALGGPACAQDDTELEDADVYFEYLEEREDSGEIVDFAAFEEGVARLFAMPDVTAQPGDVQILTIHKAKGLEFDTVILPGLGSVPRRRDPRLFLWMERPARRFRAGDAAQAQAASRLLLAPVRETGAPRDPIYDYIVELDEEKESYESARLLYVAATRARKELHLLGDTKMAAEGGQVVLKPPGAGSLLERLWPVVCEAFEARAAHAPSLAAAGEANEPRDNGGINQELRRLATDWSYPVLPQPASWQEPRPAMLERMDIEFSWAGEVARQVGNVVHRWLQRIAEDGLERWDRARLESMQEVFLRQLAGLGMDEGTLRAAAGRVSSALRHAIEDPRGRWLLGPQRESRNEYRLGALIDGERRHLIVDRMFLDQHGVRWIVDYKTSAHEGGDSDAFLDRERERYRAQLERYRKALAGTAPDAAGEPATQLGLYFPLLSGWRDWQESG